MPDSTQATGSSACWNCDRRSHEAVAVTMRAPSGGRATVALCRGCYASLYLPLVATAPELPASSGHEPTVLVVEDDPDLLDMLRYALRGKGYAVETAGNGLEALHVACRRMPDVVVLDLHMPVMDGHTFIAAWRQVTAEAPVPIVAISAQSRQPTAEELGVDAFLPKPFDLGALTGTVGRLLEAAA